MATSTEKSYLERIKFDPKLNGSLVDKYISNMRLVILLIIIIFSVGIISYFALPKRLNPEIKIPIVNVSTVLPGASPEDVESLVTIPIENALKSVKGIDTISSVSQNNVSVISMQFFSNILPEKAKNDVQTEVDAITDLPEDAKTPKVAALDFEDQPIWTFALSTNHDLPSLYTTATKLKKTLEENPQVDRIVLTGQDKQEIAVILKPEKVREYGFNPLVLSQAIQKGIASYPAGNLKTSANQFSLTIDPLINNISQIRDVLITVSGKTVRLGDITEISQKGALDQNKSYFADQKTQGQRIITVYVFKTAGVNIDAANKSVKEQVGETLQKFGNGFTVTTILNTADEIEHQFSDLIKEFTNTIILIVLCLLVFLGLRQALISSFTVPLTFLSAFFLMNLFGQTINFLTLFAFLLALGLLIDDTIVVVSAMTTYYKTGKFTPRETGLVVWRDTIIPIWSTTITTVWSFVPLLLSAGIIGEFIKPIPIVVTAVMGSSTSIAVLITLPLMIVLLKPQIPSRVKKLLAILGFLTALAILFFLTKGNVFFPLIFILFVLLSYVFVKTRKTLASGISQKAPPILKKYFNHGIIQIEPLSQLYYKLIRQILDSPKKRKRVIIAIVAYSVISFLLLPLGLVKNEFFPKTDSELVYASLDFSPGTNLEIINQESLKILDDLRKTPEVSFVICETGKRLNAMLRSESGSSTTFTIHLPTEEKRKQKSQQIAQNIRDKYKSYNQGSFLVMEETSGPPAGADLQVKLLGDDLGTLDQYADKLVTYLKSLPGITNVDKSLKPGTSKLTFIPDKTKLAENGIGVETLGFWLRMYATGFTLDSVNFDKSDSEKTDVVFYLNPETKTPSEITSINIPANGNSLPLAALGSFELRPNPSSITREQGKRTISATGSTLPGYSATTLIKEVEKYADSLKLPEGYSWKTGGINEENRKSVISILEAMALAFILILVTMVLQFQSYRQAIIVLIVIPLAVSSVFIIFALTGTPLSFPALIGVLSLFGIVVTNSMFIVDKININKRQGMPFKEAIADAGASRLEPIILTKLNTILGLLPITIANPLWRGLGGAIISGLALASIIMLLFIPAVYYEWFKDQDIPVTPGTPKSA